jgi:hypothetical protein
MKWFDYQRRTGNIFLTHNFTFTFNLLTALFSPILQLQVKFSIFN